MAVKRETATSNPEARASVPPHLAQSVINKMRARGTPVGEWDVDIDYCLESGYGEISETSGEDIKYLRAVMNSTLIRWYLEQIAPISGMETPRWKKVYVETIPIPRISTAEQSPFIRLVDEILRAKSADPVTDTSYLEWDIDRLVYDLYGLTEEEDTAIERSLGLIHQTDEEEDAALVKWMLEARTDDPADFVSEEVVMATLRKLDEG